MAERCDESIGLGYEDGLSCILDMGHDGAHIDDYPWSMHIRWELIPKPDQIVVHETTDPSSGVRYGDGGLHPHG